MSKRIPLISPVIKDGDKVYLNVKRIISRNDYSNKTALYKEFVESHKDHVFTAHIRSDDLIELEEEPLWLFWSGDLIRKMPH